MTLFEIGEQLLALDALLDESGGEVTPENEAAYDAWFAEIQESQAAKLDAYVGLLKTWEGQAVSAQAVIDQFRAKLNSLENRMKRHKDRMKTYMECTNQSKLSTTSGWVLAVQKNGGKQAVELNCPVDQLPKRFTKVKVEPDMDAIRAAIEGGEELEFAVMHPRGTHLRIR